MERTEMIRKIDDEITKREIPGCVFERIYGTSGLWSASDATLESICDAMGIG